MRLILIALLCLLMPGLAPGDNAAKEKEKKKKDRPIVVAGKSEVLRAMPKRFARLVAVDPVRRRVTLLIEGENLAKAWDVQPDAEIKVNGWWGRLDQLQVNDRVWAWFDVDRAKQPRGVRMLADELSEQAMIGGVAVESIKGDQLAVKSDREKARTLTVAAKEIRRGAEAGKLDSLKTGERVYLQSAGGKARLILDPAAFALRQSAQQQQLRKLWLSEGLPGQVLFLHVTGELEYLLDHEAMRWGRSLEPGMKVKLQTAKPIEAQVRIARPWRERTLVRLVMRGFDQADLQPGQRVGLIVPAPAAEVEKDPLPPDRGVTRPKEERVDWFLASIYCTCKVRGDGCTGHFYTLASCNPNACGMPNKTRQALAKMIDAGMTDDQIFAALLKERGPDLLRPHLLP